MPTLSLVEVKSAYDAIEDAPVSPTHQSESQYDAAAVVRSLSRLRVFNVTIHLGIRKRMTETTLVRYTLVLSSVFVATMHTASILLSLDESAVDDARARGDRHPSCDIFFVRAALFCVQLAEIAMRGAIRLTLLSDTACAIVTRAFPGLYLDDGTATNVPGTTMVYDYDTNHRRVQMYARQTRQEFNVQQPAPGWLDTRLVRALPARPLGSHSSNMRHSRADYMCLARAFERMYVAADTPDDQPVANAIRDFQTAWREYAHHVAHYILRHNPASLALFAKKCTR